MIIFSRYNDKDQFVVEFETKQILYNYCYYGYEISSYDGGGFSCFCCITIAVPFIPRVLDSYIIQSSMVLGRGLPAVSGRSNVRKAEIKAKDPKNIGGRR